MFCTHSRKQSVIACFDESAPLQSCVVFHILQCSNTVRIRTAKCIPLQPDNTRSIASSTWIVGTCKRAACAQAVPSTPAISAYPRFRISFILGAEHHGMFRLFVTGQEPADQLTSSLSFRILGRSIGSIPRSVSIQLQVCAVAAQGHTQTNRLKQGMRHCPAKAEFLISVKIQQPVPRQSRGCFSEFSIA